MLLRRTSDKWNEEEKREEISQREGKVVKGDRSKIVQENSRVEKGRKARVKKKISNNERARDDPKKGQWETEVHVRYAVWFRLFSDR